MKRHLLFAIILLLPAIVHAQYTIKVHPNNAEYGNAEGGGTFSDGDSCTVIAHANQGCEFVNWTENNNVVWPNEIYPFVVTDNRILYANFRQLPEYNIDAEVIPEGAGDVTGYGTYYEGDTCTLTAIPASGFKFGRWEKDGIVVSTDSIHSFTVTGNAFYTAYFDTIFYNISATVIPEGAGDVTGWGSYPEGDTCTLTATANPGYSFSHWQDGITDNPRTITVVADSSFTAYFAQDNYTIEVYAEPSEGGTVSGGGDNFHYGETATLTATPNPNFEFAIWNDGNSDNPREVTVTSDTSFIANFREISAVYYSVTVYANPENAGVVTGTGEYEEGSEILLEATPNPGYSFSHWQDDNTDNPRTITVVADSSFTAYFAQDNYTIEVYAEPSEGGTVSGGGDNFHYGETATLTAMANPGYSFSHWQDGITDSPRTITVVADSSFTAYFVQDNYTIEVYANPSEGGTVSGGGDNYHYGDLCTLTAGPADGFVFSNWTKNDSIVSTDSIYAFTVTESADYVAHFTEAPCIDIQEIAAKEHKEGNDTYILILVYPNPNDEEYEYQWQFSTDSLHFSDLHEGTYNKQYYYKGGRLRDGYYKVRVSKDGCSEETKPYYVNNNSHLRIYPNPSRRGNNIIVVNDCDGPAQLAIYSTDGRLLHTQTVTDSQATVSISLPQGVYIAYFTDNNGYTKVGKLIIQ